MHVDQWITSQQDFRLGERVGNHSLPAPLQFELDRRDIGSRCPSASELYLPPHRPERECEKDVQGRGREETQNQDNRAGHGLWLPVSLSGGVDDGRGPVSRGCAPGSRLVWIALWQWHILPEDQGYSGERNYITGIENRL